MRKSLLYVLIMVPLITFGQSYYDIAAAKTGQLSFDQTKIEGLWEVSQVNVGEENLTPTAKWFDFQSGGKLFSGNGGKINYRGAWTFDPNTNQLMQQNGDTKDPYGPFTVDLNQQEMTWERFENGVKVTVDLKRVMEIPLAPWDMIIGSWSETSLEESNKITNQTTITDLDQGKSYYFGWDGRYRKFNEDGDRTETGIWHIEAHSSWLWTISDADNIKKGWSIDIQVQTMTWTQEGENELLKIYFERSNN